MMRGAARREPTVLMTASLAAIRESRTFVLGLLFGVEFGA